MTDREAAALLERNDNILILTQGIDPKSLLGM